MNCVSLSYGLEMENELDRLNNTARRLNSLRLRFKKEIRLTFCCPIVARCAWNVNDLLGFSLHMADEDTTTFL